MIASTETQTAAGKPSLAEIEKLTGRYAEARDVLTNYVDTLNEKIEALKRAAMADIKRAVARTAEREAELRAAVEAAPELFTKPRTVIFHGVKVGFQKAKGTLEIPDPEETLIRLKRMFASSAAQYTHLKETLDKEALAGLSADALKKLGCTLADTGDQIVIKPTDGAVDKIVNALLKDAVQEAA